MDKALIDSFNLRDFERLLYHIKCPIYKLGNRSNNVEIDLIIFRILEDLLFSLRQGTDHLIRSHFFSLTTNRIDNLTLNRSLSE